MTQTTLRIDGMSCGHCVATVRSALSALDGVRTISVSVGSAIVEFDEARIDRSRIDAALADAGYPVLAEGHTQVLHAIKPR